MPHCPPDDPDEAMGLSTPSTVACGPWRTNQRASTSSHILNRWLPESSSLGPAPPSSQEEIHVCRERTKDTPTKNTTGTEGDGEVPETSSSPFSPMGSFCFTQFKFQHSACQKGPRTRSTQSQEGAVKNKGQSQKQQHTKILMPEGNTEKACMQANRSHVILPNRA